MPKSKNKRFGLALAAMAVAFCAGMVTLAMPSRVYAADDAQCTNIIKLGTSGSCSEFTGESITDLVVFVVRDVLAPGVTIVGTIGIIICGVLYLTARDNEGQVAQAKKRLIDVVIGVVVWALFWFAIGLIVPDQTAIDKAKGCIVGRPIGSSVNMEQNR